VVFVMRMWIRKAALADDSRSARSRPRDVDEIEKRLGIGKVQDHPQHGLAEDQTADARSHAAAARWRGRCSRFTARRSMVGLGADDGAGVYCYTAIFFTFALVLTDFFGIASNHVGWTSALRSRQLPGPAAARPTFDHARTSRDDYVHLRVSGILLALSGYRFDSAC